MTVLDFRHHIPKYDLPARENANTRTHTPKHSLITAGLIQKKHPVLMRVLFYVTIKVQAKNLKEENGRRRTDAKRRTGDYCR